MDVTNFATYPKLFFTVNGFNSNFSINIKLFINTNGMVEIFGIIINKMPSMDNAYSFIPNAANTARI